MQEYDMVATLSSFVHSGYLKSGKIVLQQVEKKWIVECHNEVHIVVDSSKTKFSYTGRKNCSTNKVHLVARRITYIGFRQSDIGKKESKNGLWNVNT